jgi:hypothetical protein
MAKDLTISNTLYWGAVCFMAIIFVATIVLNAYLFALDNQLTQQVNLLQVQTNKARLVLVYTDKNKRIFEGDVPRGALTLYDVLILSSQAGNIDVRFRKADDGRIELLSIDKFENNSSHYWELKIPSLNWQKPLNSPEVDLKKILVNGGTTVYLVYK